MLVSRSSIIKPVDSHNILLLTYKCNILWKLSFIASNNTHFFFVLPLYKIPCRWSWKIHYYPCAEGDLSQNGRRGFGVKHKYEQYLTHNIEEGRTKGKIKSSSISILLGTLKICLQFKLNEECKHMEF
ncbi:hypothetical protein H5410_038086 [Solanum commersonii]|uniref:Uncharacterized protein n=1 Tax=Solanum commersonii TaxID=4109 RepID=A0A9J5YCY7_SOLCO|nr:hypothetical protein H5410_038086 [Solanum commersonii]